MSARELIDIYISFFEKRGHKQIANSPLVPQNDSTTLFTSSGMQPLVPYLLGEAHPSGTRLVNVQNSFRALDIEEVGDNRHTTFFRMLGNWSLGDYFKAEEIPWLWEFLTVELNLPKEKLYITVFKGFGGIEKDNESFEIWKKLVPDERIFFAGVDKNWWSRSGVPDNMPIGEPGGPDTEVYYRFDELEHDKECKDNPVECECGKFLEIANAVFMQYIKTSPSAKASEGKGKSSFELLPKQNVDFGGGLERLLAAVENKSDIFQTSLFSPIIKAVEDETGKSYLNNSKEIRIITDHLTASCFILASNILPSNKERGYILRRLLRRTFDNFNLLEGENISFVLEKIAEQYKDTDPALQEKFERIKLSILEEETKYKNVRKIAADFIIKKYPSAGSGQAADDSAAPVREISADDAYTLYSTHGLSPTQIKSLGYVFDDKKFADLMEKHKELSRTASSGMFKGGLADTSELTVMGHTATHLLHQALRDVLGNHVFQTGSNITSERVRFDFNFDRNLREEEIKKVEDIANEKIKENLPVHFEMMPLKEAKKLPAIGLFDDKYAKDVKVYFVGDYSREFCGGPHVEFTGVIKKFKIVKQENIGKGQRRLYAKVADQI
ncbi:MAG: alanine--tRNA ligase [Patescibacteria group bacterium]